MTVNPKVIFAFGSRGSAAVTVAEGLSALVPESVVELWTGDARGADTFAACWADECGVKVRAFVADWENVGRSAGIRRNERLVAALPAGAIAVCFSDQAFPGLERLRREKVRSFLTPGSKHAAGLVVGRGIPLTVVWSCGSTSEVVVAAGPRPAGWWPPRRAEATDMTDATDEHFIGDEGWDASTHAARPVRKSPSWRRVPSDEFTRLWNTAPCASEDAATKRQEGLNAGSMAAESFETVDAADGLCDVDTDLPDAIEATMNAVESGTRESTPTEKPLGQDDPYFGHQFGDTERRGKGWKPGESTACIGCGAESFESYCQTCSERLAIYT